MGGNQLSAYGGRLFSPIDSGTIITIMVLWAEIKWDHQSRMVGPSVQGCGTIGPTTGPIVRGTKRPWDHRCRYRFKYRGNQMQVKRHHELVADVVLLYIL